MLSEEIMNTTNSTHGNSIAVFIDIENFIRSAMGIGLPINLEPILNKLRENGRLSMLRAYGDLDAACEGNQGLRRELRKMMYENLVQFEDIPYVTKFKNTADMRLTVEALSAAHAYPDINYIAIVAADRDYVPLIQKLRELGRRIIGIGTSTDTVNEIYVRSCDVFVYYSTLFPTDTRVDHVPEEVDESLLESYLQLLVQATSALVQKGIKAVGAQIVPLMRQLRPDFDLKLVRLDSFRDLIDLAEKRQLVSVSASGGDFQLQLGTQSPQATEQKMEVYLDTSNPVAVRSQYLAFIEEKMKCRLPPRHVRQRIYDEAYQYIESSRVMSRTHSLMEIGTELARRMEADKSPLLQPVIFKLLYALFRASTFEAELTDQPYNPKIKSCKVDAECWDLHFIRNTLKVLSREKRTWPLLEQPLAQMFETSPEVIGKEIDAIWNQFV